MSDISYTSADRELLDLVQAALEVELITVTHRRQAAERTLLACESEHTYAHRKTLANVHALYVEEGEIKLEIRLIDDYADIEQVEKLKHGHKWVLKAREAAGSI